ncbi:MAG: hypothetical protein RJA09_1612 [Pseudomonadota bacterium]|jgi:hemerythrin-like metal-binding protein
MAATTAENPTSTSPPPLLWGEALVTGDARMDDTHEEFVTLLAALRAQAPEAQLDLYRELVRHTEAHFAQEDRWMVATGFTPQNCHSMQHNSVLETMREVEKHHLQGDTEIIGRMADALADWFPQHARSMDAGLAQHLQSVGYDSQSETLADPTRIAGQTQSGCGSTSCS